MYSLLTSSPKKEKGGRQSREGEMQGSSFPPFLSHPRTPLDSLLAGLNMKVKFVSFIAPLCSTDYSLYF